MALWSEPGALHRTQRLFAGRLRSDQANIAAFLGGPALAKSFALRFAGRPGRRPAAPAPNSSDGAPHARAVDAVIQGILPAWEPGDVLLSAGNSHYRKTERRQQGTGRAGVNFLGGGDSGGTEGALTAHICRAVREKATTRAP